MADRIVDRSRLARYLVQFPTMAARDMTPDQLAIYVQYLVKCGAGGGRWCGGLADVAQCAGMSVNTARAARRWLVDNSWLTVAGEGPRGALDMEISDRWADALDAANIGPIDAGADLIRSDQIRFDQIRSDQVKSDQVDPGGNSTSDPVDQIRSDQVGRDSSRSLPPSSSSSIDPTNTKDPEKATTTTPARPADWASVDQLTDRERAACDALHDAGLNGTSAAMVRTHGAEHCINHAAVFLADSEQNQALRPPVLLWRLQNQDTPAISRLPGNWRLWWDRYADRAGLLPPASSAAPAPPADSGPPADDSDPLAGLLPELREIVRCLEHAGTMDAAELAYYFASASGSLEDDGATLRILHPDGARLSFLRDRMERRISMARPDGIERIVFGQGVPA